MSSVKDTPVIFECTYGEFPPRLLWLIFLLGIIGVVGVPVGIVLNEGWRMNNRPVEPWAATLIIEILAGGALLLAVSLGIAAMMRRKSPQRIVLTDSALIVPKNLFSSTELELPLTEVQVAIFNAGYVKQLQLKHKRCKVLLASGLFPSKAEFDDLVDRLLNESSN